MRVLIRRFDALLSRILGVYEFCDDVNCVLRLQISQASRALCFAGQKVNIGESVLLLHLWNEHIPHIPQDGPDLAWAAQMRRLFLHSLRAVAVYMASDQSLTQVSFIGGTTTLFSPQGQSGGRRFLQRLGFTILPYRSPLGRFGEFWENFYAWWLMWTFNTVSLRHRRLLQLRRSEFWITVDEFLKLYGPRETL